MSHDPRQDAPTLVDLVHRRAQGHGDRLAYLFLENGEEEGGRLTYAELDRRARALAVRLRDAGLEGQRALMLYPPGLDFVIAFLGCLYAGVVAVPAYPPASKRHLPRLRSIVVDSEPTVALTVEGQMARLRRAAATLDQLAGLSWWATDAFDTEPAGDVDWQRPAIDGDTLAFLQYTSGSTADPKGVRVAHRNLLHNEAVIERGFGNTADDLIVGWLPLYHDMGLIGNLLQPLWLGTGCVFMAPVAFLQKPHRWLAAISKYGGTVSGGPNFAYELCVQRINEEQRRGLDLSSWRLAFSGAEPVRAETLERFARTFAPQGFRSSAFFPCYGMAETTLMTTGGPPGREPVVWQVDAAALEQGRAESAEGEDAKQRPLVGCGGVGQDLDVAVVDPASHERLDGGRIGEIWVSGPSVAEGYWQRAEASRETFEARLVGDATPWLRTGDLGVLEDGELFVTGRLKDLVILRGRNHYPQDLELTAQRAHPSLRLDSGAAFAVEVAGEERLVIVHEVERRPSDPPELMVDAIRRAVSEEHEVQVYDVVLIRVGTLPKTSSGKIQRARCRQEYLDEALTILGRSTLATDQAESLVGAEVALDGAALRAVEATERHRLLADFLADRAARLARVPRASLDLTTSLAAIGLDSLAAVELKNSVEEAVGVELELTRLLEGPTLDGLAKEILAAFEDGGERTLDDSIPTLDQANHPLSPGQQALWYLHRLDPESAAYNLGGATLVVDVAALDADAFAAAACDLVRRHPALRTTFHAVRDADPIARVGEDSRVEVERVDTTGWSDERLRDEVASWIERPFDLATGPPIRIALLRDKQLEQAHLALAIHHIVADFWSLGLLLRDLGALYRRRRNASGDPQPFELPPLERTPADFARWHHRRVATEGERLWEHWRDELAGELPALDLPTDRPRPPVQTFRGSAVIRPLPAPLATGLRGLARQRGITLFTVLLAGFQTLLHRLSGQDEVIVGSPATLRAHPGLGDVVSYLVNPLVLRSWPGAAASFSELLDATRPRVMAALAHAELPFPTLVERLAPDHDASRSPLFQALIVLQKDRPDEQGLAGFALGREGSQLDLGGLPLESLALPHNSAQFDLSLVAAESGDDLGLRLEFNRDLFDATTAERWSSHFETLLTAIVEEPSRSLARLPLLTEGELRQLLVERNHRPLEGAELEAGDTLHGLFFRQARETPERVALWAADNDEDASHEITYAQLATAVAGLAHHLRSRGVGPEVRVGVLAPRRPELVVGLLGVLAAGGAYVPLDPAYPADRIGFTLEDSAVPVLLVCGGLPEGLGEIEITAEVIDLLDFSPASGAVEPAEPPTSETSADHLGYVIYTSGSTGRPKGVAIAHHSAVALLRWARTEFDDDALRGVLASTSVCFDLSVFEIFLPLATGGRIVLVENALALPRLDASAAVTLVNTVPSAMGELAGRLPSSVRVVNLAGEPLGRELVEAIAEQGIGVAIYNLYGPSEDTTYSTWVRVPTGVAEPPTIGVPIAESRAILVDRHGEPSPEGVPGELLLGGAGLARGYLGRPALTAERFVPDPWSQEPGSRLYRTGDLVRWGAGEELEFLGRLDHQVKVRGFRIELGEIRSTLVDHPGVDDAVVVARDAGGSDAAGGDLTIVAYWVASEGETAPDVATLRRHLEGLLPGYMVPQAWARLEALPLTPNGKIDRKALTAPDVTDHGSTYVAPETAVEEMLVEVWQEVLGLERIGVEDSFFDLGGHSLKATQVLTRVEELFGVDLPVRALLESPTITGLAEAIAMALLEDADEDTVAALLAGGE